MPTLINVSNRLPVTVSEDKITQSSGGLVAALEGLSGDKPGEKFDLKWIGWPGAEIPQPRQDDVRRTLETEHGASPVFLTAEEQEGFYEGFSNSSLWPLLHYMPSKFRYDPAWWDQYRTVNQRFCRQIVSVAKDDDLVWVHDYQLMLLPGMLRCAMPSLKVGFFLHTPFPSYEVFRCHPRRDELVRGVLGADQVGFHTFGYMRHFRSAVLRLLGIDSEITRIRHDHHTTHLGIYPIGINAQKFEETLDSPEFAAEMEIFEQTHQSKRVVLSVERLDYTKGILHRLDAMEMFLDATTEEYRERLKFIFIAVPSREGVEEYKELRDEVEHRVGRLNGKYATLHNSPVRFIHGSVNFTQLCALYNLADVGVVTPLIDGMNLVAKEFVACQRDGDAPGTRPPGVLVLSEFAGAAEELFNALIVNPYDAQAVANAIAQGLSMSSEERRGRMRGMRERVMNFDARRWAGSFIDDLAKRTHAEDQGHDIAEARQRAAAALTAKQRIALFLDYDGTLREIERDPMAASPNAAVHELLSFLRERRNVHVTLISGRSAENLQAWVGSYPIGLIAEHGAALRRPGHAEWEQLDRNVSYAWKDELLRVLKLYEASTPGSFVENKRTSLVWHYRKSDPEFGEWKAKQLTEELASLTANMPLHVRQGKKIVEITATQINKGAAIGRILDEQCYDLVLCAGDDVTDESMFRLELPNLVSIKIGDGKTHARYQVPNPAAFRKFLTDALGTALHPGPRFEARSA